MLRFDFKLKIRKDLEEIFVTYKQEIMENNQTKEVEHQI